jgi:uncharacterized protein YrrD
MVRNVNSLIGFSMGATDGEIGKVDEFYFDDESWTIRYLVVKTGGWLSERKVLISPIALKTPDWENESFPVKLTKEQVKHSPDIDTQMPVSRQQEMALYNYYEWPYGDPIGAGFYGGMGMLGMVESRVPLAEYISARQVQKKSGDPHLRSTDEVKGYRIHATDGEIGDVADFMIDENWKIRFLIINTGSWLKSRKVLISPAWIRTVSWTNAAVNVNVSMQAIKNSPPYDPDLPMNPSYESELYRHYG